jgi:hypothetical protein
MHPAWRHSTVSSIGPAADVPPPPRRRTGARNAGRNGARHPGDAAASRRRSEVRAPNSGAPARTVVPAGGVPRPSAPRGQAAARRARSLVPEHGLPEGDRTEPPSAGKGSQGSSRAGLSSGGEPERRRALGVGTGRLAGTALLPEPRGAAAARESEMRGRRNRDVDRRRSSSVGADPHRHRDDEQADRDERCDILKKVGHEFLPFLSMASSCSCFVPFASLLFAGNAPH